MPARTAWLKQSVAHYGYAREAGARGFHFYNNWGTASFRLGAYEQAIELYKKALQFHGDITWALSNWGNALLAQGKYKEAEQKYAEAMASNITGASIEGFLSSKLSQLGTLTNTSTRKEALTALLASFDKLKREWPTLTPGSYAIASYAYCLLGNREQALAHQKKMMSPDSSNYLSFYAKVDECIEGLTEAQKKLAGQQHATEEKGVSLGSRS